MQATEALLRQLTVPQLKECLKTLNERRTGNKPDLLARVNGQINAALDAQDVVRIRFIKRAIEDATTTPRS